MFLQHWSHGDAAGPALGRQSVLQVYHLMSWLQDTNQTQIRGDCFDLPVENVV